MENSNLNNLSVEDFIEALPDSQKALIHSDANYDLNNLSVEDFIEALSNVQKALIHSDANSKLNNQVDKMLKYLSNKYLFTEYSYRPVTSIISDPQEIHEIYSTLAAVVVCLIKQNCSRLSPNAPIHLIWLTDGNKLAEQQEAHNKEIHPVPNSEIFPHRKRAYEWALLNQDREVYLFYDSKFLGDNHIRLIKDPKFYHPEGEEMPKNLHIVDIREFLSKNRLKQLDYFREEFKKLPNDPNYQYNLGYDSDVIRFMLAESTYESGSIYLDFDFDAREIENDLFLEAHGIGVSCNGDSNVLAVNQHGVHIISDILNNHFYKMQKRQDNYFPNISYMLYNQGIYLSHNEPPGFNYMQDFVPNNSKCFRRSFDYNMSDPNVRGADMHDFPSPEHSDLESANNKYLQAVLSVLDVLENSFPTKQIMSIFALASNIFSDEYECYRSHEEKAMEINPILMQAFEEVEHHLAKRIQTESTSPNSTQQRAQNYDVHQDCGIKLQKVRNAKGNNDKSMIISDNRSKSQKQEKNILEIESTRKYEKDSFPICLTSKPPEVASTSKEVQPKFIFKGLKSFVLKKTGFINELLSKSNSSQKTDEKHILGSSNNPIVIDEEVYQSTPILEKIQTEFSNPKTSISRNEIDSTQSKTLHTAKKSYQSTPILEKIQTEFSNHETSISRDKIDSTQSKTLHTAILERTGIELSSLKAQPKMLYTKRNLKRTHPFNPEEVVLQKKSHML